MTNEFNYHVAFRFVKAEDSSFGFGNIHVSLSKKITVKTYADSIRVINELISATEGALEKCEYSYS